MMLRAVILVAVFGLAMPAWADPAGLTQRRTDLEIESDRLGETRRLIVQVPSSYAAEPGRTYPVFVLTDAIWQFDLVAATLDYHARWGRIPEHIVVGLYNPERNLDLVPAADPGYPSTGGGDAYLAHVTAEVLPVIEARYRTNGVELLFGHSFGGVMTLNQLLTAPEAFDGYIALGASTWVADRILFDRLDEAAMTPMAGRVLYMGVGETDGGATVPDGERFAAELEARDPAGLDWTFEVRPGENHFTNVPEGLHRALGFIYPFADQQAAMVEAGRRGGPAGVRAWFDDRETALGWRFVPQAMELGLAGFQLALAGEEAASHAVFDALEARYPDNVEVVAVRANALGQTQRYEDALAALDRAIALGEAEGHPPSRLAAFRAYRARLVARREADR